MATAGLLAQYMAINNQYTYCEQQQIKWNNLKEAMSKKLSDQEKWREKWDTASEALEADWTDTTNTDGSAKEYKAGGLCFQNKSGGHPAGYARSQAPSIYACKCVPKYDAKKLEEYEALDMEYDTMTTMYDTLLESLDAQKQKLGDNVGKEAQDTHILG